MLPKIVLLLLAIATLHPAVSSAAALVMGLCYGIALGHPLPDVNKTWIRRLLAWSIVGIGAGMNLHVLAKVGFQGLGYTMSGILLTMALGHGLGLLLKTPRELSVLLNSGTAICGGSAIAAISGVLGSRRADISTALIIVFLLNSVALLIFPEIGRLVGLTESQFGLWSALAIHDTSSVVGATLRYGPEAVEIGTTVKLARALWIVPLALALGLYTRSKDKSASERASPQKPWFILGFVIAAAAATWIPALESPGAWIAAGAKRLFVLTLFLIGSGFNRAELRAMSPRPLVQALLLWVLVAGASLLLIQKGWIHAGF